MNRLKLHSSRGEVTNQELPSPPFVYAVAGDGSLIHGEKALSSELMSDSEIDEFVLQMKLELDEFSLKAKQELRKLKPRL